MLYAICYNNYIPCYILYYTVLYGMYYMHLDASLELLEVMRAVRILRVIKVLRLVGTVRMAQDLQLLINCLLLSLKRP